MLGGADPTSVLGSSTDLSSVVAPIGGANEGGGGGGGDVGSNSGTDEDKGRGDDGDRSFGGNRWPRQETLALLKIRSDMDQVFRDSSLKGPLWEEVSRKLAERGYNRSSKKCKEKFENVYKYHKRTKEGRSGKSEGKHYKFFDQLEAFDNHNQNHHRPIHQPPPKPQTPMQTTPPMAWPNIAPPTTTADAAAISHININPSTTNPINFAPPPPPTTNPTVSTTTPTHNISGVIPSSFPNNVSANLFSSSTSSSTASDEETEDVGDHKRKRKWKEFFKRITKQVIRKQEELQDKFLIAIEKREHERVVREEAWRVQELARINREHEILIKERSTSAAKDAAVIAFLQKIAGQQQNYPASLIIPTPPPPAAAPPPPPPPLAVTNLDTSPKPANNGENNNGVLVQSSSRWPKAEIEALIQLRTDLSLKYQENGPKGPLWEEISAGMRGLGYNRSSKRCKEKWENINKYFKKVKDSNKKRPQDSKTCPYFSQLDALYREKSKIDQINLGYGNPIKPVIITMVPLMVQPEQQWPLQQENADQIQDQEDEDDDDDDEDDDGNSEEEYEGGGYEIVANKAASMGTTGE
ncbi:hypothetical protein Ddye_005551 [Dipteronia dyeriana]|uniref:Myb-like domain-containing protein n=1 Tax=Dipteronia dyeriana TaxID=168575 RepID=A0AAD9XHC5_9ROSI|nr:hypothetical protein Ddye_005551 [Dipteronia dyeriana]